jgi:type II secretion system protein N
LRFDSVRFDFAGNRILEAEQVRVGLKLASLLTARKILLFSFKAHAGSVVGKAFITATNKNGPFDIEAVITGMQLADIPAIKKLSVFELSGVLGVEFNYQTGPEISNAWRARIEVTDIELRSENRSLNQDLMAFERIDAFLSMHDRRLELESCTFTGDQYDGTLSGFGVLKNPFNESTIAFSGRLTLHHPILSRMEGNLPPEWLKGLKSKIEDMSIFIGGSIENPTFSFE